MICLVGRTGWFYDFGEMDRKAGGEKQGCEEVGDCRTRRQVPSKSGMGYGRVVEGWI